MSALSALSAPAHSDRFLAPDLARGLMLARIAVANVMLYLHVRPGETGGPPRLDGAWDLAVSAVTTTVVDARAVTTTVVDARA